MKRLDRPKETVISENISQILKIVMNVCKMKVREIFKIVNISTGSAFTNLHKKMDI